MRDQRQTISIAEGVTRLIVTEGGDGAHLFRRLVDDLGLSRFQIVSAEGKDHFKPTLSVINTLSEFAAQIKAVGVVGDADDDPDKAFQEICDALREAGLSPPTSPDLLGAGFPKVRVLIVPTADERGTLETLCLEAVGADPRMRCVEDFVACVEAKGSAIPDNRRGKAKAHAFLASCPDPVAGVGAGFTKRRDYWNLGDPVWDRAKEFLKSL